MITRDVHGSTLDICLGDITEIECDAIVNAANPYLAGGGGVDGAIHRVGGPSIMTECRRIGGCPVGQAVVTTAGELRAQYVIHTVGPVWSAGESNDADLLRSAYTQSLRQAAEHMARSVAFPSISTGSYAYPIDLAAPIALQSVIDFLEGSSSVEQVHFVLFSMDDFYVYQEVLFNLVDKPSLGCWWPLYSEKQHKLALLTSLGRHPDTRPTLVALRQLPDHPDWEADTLRLLHEADHRGLLAIGLALHITGRSSFPILAGFWPKLKRGTGAMPEVLCLLSKIDPDFLSRAEELLEHSFERTETGEEVAATLGALAEQGAWTPGASARSRIARLSPQDTASVTRKVQDALAQLS